MKIYRLGIGLLAIILAIPSFQAKAQEHDALALINKVNEFSGKISYEGTRRLQVMRVNTNPLVSRAEVRYADPNNFSLKIKDPISIAGIHFNVVNGINSAYFPDEKIYLYNGDKAASDMPVSIILSEVSDNLELLQKNYSMARLKDDFVALNPAYVIDLQPLHGLTRTPGRRYWISQQTFQVLREERYWDPNTEAYYNSHYENFSIAKNKPKIDPIMPPTGVNKVDLGTKNSNSFITYSRVAAAEQQEKLKILMPDYVPPGFQFKNVQVFSLFGGRIQILNFTDGLNKLMVNIRPQQNMFVTLLAGAFSISLLKKMSDLSYHAPNNYMNRPGTSHMAVAFGDVSPDELKKVLDSIPLPN